LGFFTDSSRLLLELRRAVKANQKSVRVNYVTGGASVRYFHEGSQIEINRHQRTKHPLTLVYIELDNFKVVSDLMGHIIGDKVLRAITENIQLHIPPTDLLARKI